MNKAKKRFVRYAMLSILVLLTVLLGIINVVSFSMAGDEADKLTERLAEGRGRFTQQVQPPKNGFNMQDGRPPVMGPTGPDSPEMSDSLRYFCFAFGEDDEYELVEWKISAVTEDEALEWARSLLKESPTGWTAKTYRYRVFKEDGKKYVIVIDVARDIVPSYRILVISCIGLAAGLVIGYIFLMYVGNMLFKPLEETDRKQKIFISEVEKEFKAPLTIINANTEIMERQNGETEETRSINRQVKRMIALVKNIAAAGVFDEKNTVSSRFDLSTLSASIADAAKPQFDSQQKTFDINTGDCIMMEGDMEAIHDLVEELIKNALKFSLSKASLEIKNTQGRINIVAANDTGLPDGQCDQVFDRFTMLENAAEIPGAGLGLSKVKDIVKAHNGRISAKVEGGIFTVIVGF